MKNINRILQAVFFLSLAYAVYVLFLGKGDDRLRRFFDNAFYASPVIFAGAMILVWKNYDTLKHRPSSIVFILSVPWIPVLIKIAMMLFL